MLARNIKLYLSRDLERHEKEHMNFEILLHIPQRNQLHECLWTVDRMRSSPPVPFYSARSASIVLLLGWSMIGYRSNAIVYAQRVDSWLLYGHILNVLCAFTRRRPAADVRRVIFKLTRCRLADRQWRSTFTATSFQNHGQTWLRLDKHCLCTV